SARHIDVFYSFADDALWVAAGLLNGQKRAAKCLAGMYGPGDYGVGPAVLNHSWLVPLAYPESHLFLSHLPACCRVFMNEAMRQRLETRSHVPVSGRIW